MKIKVTAEMLHQAFTKASPKGTRAKPWTSLTHRAQETYADMAEYVNEGLQEVDVALQAASSSKHIHRVVSPDGASFHCLTCGKQLTPQETWSAFEPDLGEEE